MVGFLVYSAGVVWIYRMGLRIVHEDSRFNAVGVVTCFLIANTTNPYLCIFDFIWVIFLSIAFIHCWLITKAGQQ